MINRSGAATGIAVMPIAAPMLIPFFSPNDRYLIGRTIWQIITA